MNKSKIIIVNKNDKIINHKERETLAQSDIYRVSVLWIQNPKGDILLAQRSFNKKKNPGKWGPAVAGTNDEGESYESNIIKEAEEELGLKNIKIKKLFHKLAEDKRRRFFQWFITIIDKEIFEFTIQKEEVEKIKWFTKEELLKELNKFPNKFLNSKIKECMDYLNE